MAKIKLLAYLKPVGWAFVSKSDGSIWLTRPPFLAKDLESTNEDAVARAIYEDTYIPSGQEFDDWRKLAAFLKSEVLAESNKRGEEAAKSGKPSRNVDDIRREAFRNAPPEILMKHLEAIENEIIPSGDIDHALKLLNILREEDKIEDDKYMRNKTMELIAFIAEQLHSRISRPERAASETIVQFAPVYSKRGKEIVEKRQREIMEGGFLARIA